MIKNTSSLNIRHNNTQNTSYKKSLYNYVWAFLVTTQFSPVRGFMFGSCGILLVLVAGVIGAVSFLWDYNGLFCYKKKAIKY